MMLGFIWAVIQFVFSVALYAGIVGVLAWGYFSVVDWPPTEMQAQGGALLLGVVAVGTWLGWLSTGKEKP